MEIFYENNERVTLPLMTMMDNVIKQYQGDTSRLLEILLEIQSQVEGQYISKAMAFYIAEALQIKASRIYDVLTFFSSLHSKPRAKYPIQVCESIVCKANEGDNLYVQLKEVLGVDLGEVTYDGRFTLEKVPCFGACDRAPAVRVNGRVYGPLKSKEQVIDLIKALV